MKSDSPTHLDYETPVQARQSIWKREVPPRMLWRVGIGMSIAWLLLLTIIPFRPSRYAAAAVNRVKCASGLRQVGQLLHVYAAANGGAYPPRIGEVIAADPDYAPLALVCPTSTDTPATGPTTRAVAAAIETGGHLSYVYVGAGINVAARADMVVAYEPPAHPPTMGGNVLFNDGSVAWKDARELRWVMQELALGHNPPRSGTYVRATRPAPR